MDEFETIIYTVTFTVIGTVLGIPLSFKICRFVKWLMTIERRLNNAEFDIKVDRKRAENDRFRVREMHRRVRDLETAKEDAS